VSILSVRGGSQAVASKRDVWGGQSVRVEQLHKCMAVGSGEATHPQCRQHRLDWPEIHARREEGIRSRSATRGLLPEGLEGFEDHRGVGGVGTRVWEE